jgi:hypothetical protein
MFKSFPSMLMHTPVLFKCNHADTCIQHSH